jgi:hypothetical protein
LHASQQAGVDEKDFELKQALVRQVKFQVTLHVPHVMNENTT